MILTTVQTCSEGFVPARHLRVQGQHPRDRSALYQEIVRKIEGFAHKPITYAVGGMEFTEDGAERLKVSTEPQAVNAPDCPVVRLETISIGNPENIVTVFTRPLGPYERDNRKMARVFLVALDTGRWMKFPAWKTNIDS